jgi:hypothetical protein
MKAASLLILPAVLVPIYGVHQATFESGEEIQVVFQPQGNPAEVIPVGRRTGKIMSGSPVDGTDPYNDPARGGGKRPYPPKFDGGKRYR